MQASEKICPSCRTRNKPDAVICERCGVQLDDPFADSGHETKTTDMQALTPEMVRDWLFKDAKEAAAPDKGIAFYIEGQSKPAYIDSKGDFVLGRKTGTTSEMLFDLAPFGGYSQGISRRHVAIRQVSNSFEVIDLGGVNGTWLNEERLVPHTAYPLPSGSHLRLGRMRLYVLYRPFEKAR